MTVIYEMKGQQQQQRRKRRYLVWLITKLIIPFVVHRDTFERIDYDKRIDKKNYIVRNYTMTLF